MDDINPEVLHIRVIILPISLEVQCGAVQFFTRLSMRILQKPSCKMDHILTATGIEHRMLTGKILKDNAHHSIKRQERLYRRYRQALRYCILIGITGFSFRSLSIRGADSQLFQWFTYTDSIGLRHRIRDPKYSQEIKACSQHSCAGGNDWGFQHF